ncbi:MAG: tetratricopeptide repeat protein [Bacteroidota bacterium]
MDTDSLLQAANEKKDTPGKVNAMMFYALQHIKKDSSVAFDFAQRGFELAKKIKDKKGELFYYGVIGEYYRVKINYEKSDEFFQKGLEIALQAQEDSIAGLFYHQTASNYQLQTKYSEAMIDYEKAMELRKKCNDKKGMAGTVNNMAIIFKLWGDLPRALDLYMDAVDINREIGNNDWLVKNYNNIGGVYYDMKQIEKSLEYYHLSLDMKKELKDTAGMISCYNNIGMVLKSERMFDSSLAVLKNSQELGISQSMKNNPNLATTNINIGSVYIEQKKYEEALFHFNEAIRISEFNKDRMGLANAFLKVGQLYRDMKNYPKALEFFKNTLELAKEMRNLEKLMWVSAGLATTYEALGDFKNALLYQKEYKFYSDSLLNGDKIKELTEIGMMHQFNQQKKADSLQLAQEKKLKDLEDEQLRKENEEKLQKQKTYTWFGGGLALLMLVLAFVLLRGYRNKQKANLLITEQKKAVEEQKAIIEEKHKEITDSINYANRIQTALLHNEEHWKKISPEYFIFFRPKDVVSGDFYWAHNTETKSIWVVADCTGHGVPGALMSMLGISFLNEIVAENKITDPAQVLNKLREKIITAFGSSGSNQPHRDGMDISVCVWNKKTNLLEYAGANNGVWIVRKIDKLASSESSETQLLKLSQLSKLIELKPDKMPVGVHDHQHISFTTKTHQLEKGDLVINYSDGYADQFGGAKGKKYKYSRLHQFFTDQYNEKPKTINEKLENEFSQWKGNFEQLDDVCITGIKII